MKKQNKQNQIAIGSDYHGDVGRLAYEICKAAVTEQIYLAGDIGQQYIAKGDPPRQYQDNGTVETTKESIDMFVQNNQEDAKSYFREIVDSTLETKALLEMGDAEHITHFQGNGVPTWDALLMKYYSDEVECGEFQLPSKIYQGMKIVFETEADVHVYKEGKKGDFDEGDTAVITIPYSKNKQELKESVDNAVQRVIRANPKYVLQIQHEHPNHMSSDYTRKSDNEDTYMNAIEKVVEGCERLEKYNVFFGHLEKGSKAYKVIELVNGKKIAMYHIDEGEDMIYVDVKTGEVIDEPDEKEIKEGGQDE